MTTPTPYRQRKVEDALAYLDKVKSAYEDRAEMYNCFLDIMKEFKAQRVDTPGVIDRILSLFRGDRALLLGFNTFLPPGYKIEFPTKPWSVERHAEEASPEQRQQVPYLLWLGRTLGKRRDGAEAAFGDVWLHHIMPQLVTHTETDEPVVTLKPKPKPPPPMLPLPSAVMSPLHQPPLPAGELAQPRRAPIEFDQAINYVNKIKQRFAQEPAIYRAFLEILHTYQKEQKSIKDVYEEVSRLFRDHLDLLAEFSQFLPEGSPAEPPAESLQQQAEVEAAADGPAADDGADEESMPWLQDGGLFAEEDHAGCAEVAAAASADAAPPGAKFQVGAVVILFNGSLRYEAEIVEVTLNEQTKPAGKGRAKAAPTGPTISYLVRYTKWTRRREEWVNEAFVYPWDEAAAKAVTNRPPRNQMWVEHKGGAKALPDDGDVVSPQIGSYGSSLT